MTKNCNCLSAVYNIALCISRLIVPPSPPVIRMSSPGDSSSPGGDVDGGGRVLHDATDHLREGAAAAIVCESTGGEPMPRLSW